MPYPLVEWMFARFGSGRDGCLTIWRGVNRPRRERFFADFFMMCHRFGQKDVQKNASSQPGRSGRSFEDSLMDGRSIRLLRLLVGGLSASPTFAQESSQVFETAIIGGVRLQLRF